MTEYFEIHLPSPIQGGFGQRAYYPTDINPYLLPHVIAYRQVDAQIDGNKLVKYLKTPHDPWMHVGKLMTVKEAYDLAKKKFRERGVIPYIKWQASIHKTPNRRILGAVRRNPRQLVLVHDLQNFHYSAFEMGMRHIERPTPAEPIATPTTPAKTAITASTGLGQLVPQGT